MNVNVCSKWKVDRHAVVNVRCHDDGALLLTAGRTIKLWNLNDYTMIKVSGWSLIINNYDHFFFHQRFTGHSTSVDRLQFLDACWFISSAQCDRTINVW